MQVSLMFDLPEESLASDIRDALNLNKKMSRGTVNILSDGSKLLIKIEANDLTAMRAALNTHLRLLDSLINVWEVVENG